MNTDTTQKRIYRRIHVMDDIRVFVVPNYTGEKSSGKKKVQKFISICSGILIVTLCFMVSRTGATVSYFSDSESSVANSLHAGRLLFDVVPNSFDIHVGTDIASSSTIVPSMIPGIFSFPIQYNITASTTGGSSGFCSALLANATNTPFVYSGPLATLVTGTSTTSGPWPVVISLPSNTVGITNGDVCNVDLIYSGWSAVSPSNNGYHDSQEISLTIHADILTPIDIVASSTATSAATSTATTTEKLTLFDSNIGGDTSTSSSTSTPNIGGGGPISSDAGKGVLDSASSSTSTPPQASTTPPVASTSPDIASTTGEQASTTPDISTSTPDISTSTPDLATSTPDTSSSTPDLGSSTPDLPGNNSTISTSTDDIILPIELTASTTGSVITPPVEPNPDPVILPIDPAPTVPPQEPAAVLPPAPDATPNQ